MLIILAGAVQSASGKSPFTDVNESDNRDIRAPRGFSGSESSADQTLDEPISTSYLMKNENFNLLGAWQMYYSGTAITTSNKGTAVNSSGDLPYLIGDANGRKMMFDGSGGTQMGNSPVDEFANGNTYFAFDIRIMNISPNEYPFVRVGYRVSDDSVPTLGLVSGSVESRGPIVATAKTTHTITLMNDTASGWQTFTVNVNEIPDFTWVDGDGEITLSLFAGSDTVDMEILYFAMFKTAEAATTFNINDHKAFISDKNNAIHADINYQPVPEAVINGYMAEAETKKRNILYAKDINPATIKGACYYISSVNGKDDNDGLSPDTPWKSISKLYNVSGGGQTIQSILNCGDAVFFERGSEFFAGESWFFTGQFVGQGFLRVLEVAAGVTYAAYGEGPKPLFTNAVKFDDGTKTGTWIETNVKNVYVLDQIITKPETRDAGWNDICSISFDDGRAWGVRVLTIGEIKDDKAAIPPFGRQTTDVGWWTNGLEYYYRDSITFESIETSLRHNLEYYFDQYNGKLYLRCNDGNPADVFETIRPARFGTSITSSVSDNSIIDVTFDNLAVKHSGRHGMEVRSGVSVTNCEFSFIGGTICSCGSTVSVRMGNAIESWGNIDGYYAANNYFSHIWDTAITAQGSGVMKNILWHDNVIEYANTPFELWTFSGRPDTMLVDTTVRDNLMIYVGARMGAVYWGGVEFGQKQATYPIKNVVYENNVAMFVSGVGFCDGYPAMGSKASGKIFRNNVYIMGSDTGFNIRTRKNIAMRIGNFQTILPYTEQFTQYLANIGIDSGSTFYYYSGYNVHSLDRLKLFYPNVVSGDLLEAKASWWGFDPKDSTRFLQAAINSKVPRLIIDLQASPWITGPLVLADNQEIVFEEGVELSAKAGLFHGRGDSLLTATNTKNLKLVGLGQGAVLRMRKSDYHVEPYSKSEWRHGIALHSVEDVTVENLSIVSSGGDGIYIGDARRGVPCRNVTIRNVVCDDNNRQGISVISANKLLIEDCVLKNTWGTPPAAGIDFEPNLPEDQLVDCVMRRCLVENNNGAGIQIYLIHIEESPTPISIRIEDCIVRRSKDAGFYFSVYTPYEVPEDQLKGSCEMIGCQFENCGYAGIVIDAKRADLSTLTLKETTIIDCGKDEKRYPPVRLRTHEFSDFGGIDLGVIQITDPFVRSPIIFDKLVHYPKNFRGTLHLMRGEQTEIIEINDAWFTKEYPNVLQRIPLEEPPP